MKFFNWNSSTTTQTPNPGATNKLKRQERVRRDRRGASNPTVKSETTKKKRRHSQSSLPRDVFRNNSYYAPKQHNFYPPNVVTHYSATNHTDLLPVYHSSNAERQLVEALDEKNYAQQLYKNQFLFFKPRKSDLLWPYANNGQTILQPKVPPLFGQANYQFHHLPLRSSTPVNQQQQERNWNWGFHSGLFYPKRIHKVRIQIAMFHYYVTSKDNHCLIQNVKYFLKSDY